MIPVTRSGRERDDDRVILEPTRPQLDVAARTFALLSAPVRLHLVALAAEGEYDVGTLSQRVGVSIATASQHLTKLRLAGIISAHREGRRQIYIVAGAAPPPWRLGSPRGSAACRR